MLQAFTLARRCKLNARMLAMGLARVLGRKHMQSLMCPWECSHPAQYGSKHKHRILALAMKVTTCLPCILATRADHGCVFHIAGYKCERWQQRLCVKEKTAQIAIKQRRKQRRSYLRCVIFATNPLLPLLRLVCSDMKHTNSVCHAF